MDEVFLLEWHLVPPEYRYLLLQEESRALNALMGGLSDEFCFEAETTVDEVAGPDDTACIDAFLMYLGGHDLSFPLRG